MYQDEGLRVVSDDTFQRAQRRSQDISNPDKRLKRGGRARYLLSGLLKCDVCGAKFVLTSKSSYQCSGHVGGACSNGIRVRRDKVEEKILGPIRTELLSPERVARMALEIKKGFAERAKSLAEKSTPEEVQILEARIDGLRERLSAGDVDFEPDELRLAIQCAEGKRQELLDAQPAALESAKILSALPKAAQAYRRQIELGLDNNPREAAKARVILRELLGTIRMCPGPDRTLWAEFDARPAALIQRAVGASVGVRGSGGVICVIPTVLQRVRVK